MLSCELQERRKSTNMDNGVLLSSDAEELEHEVAVPVRLALPPKTWHSLPSLEGPPPEHILLTRQTNRKSAHNSHVA